MRWQLNKFNSIMLTSSCYFKGAVSSPAALRNFAGKIIFIGVCAIENFVWGKKKFLRFCSCSSWSIEFAKLTNKKTAWFESGAIHWLWTMDLYFLQNVAIFIIKSLLTLHILIQFSLKIGYWAFFLEYKT